VRPTTRDNDITGVTYESTIGPSGSVIDNGDQNCLSAREKKPLHLMRSEVRKTGGR
jgi:hypothetical protein